MTIFDVLKDVIKDKSGVLVESSEFESGFNTYMIARYLSMRTSLMPYAQWLNQFGGVLPKSSQYKFLIDNVPQSNNCFIKYLKKPKKEKDSVEESEE